MSASSSSSPQLLNKSISPLPLLTTFSPKFHELKSDHSNRITSSISPHHLITGSRSMLAKGFPRMRLAMVDCRGLIQFCRAFHPHNQTTSSRVRTRRLSPNSLNPFSDHLCDRSPLAALDFAILLIVLASLAFLFLPYFKFVASEILPILSGFVIDLVLDDPLPYFVGFVFALMGLVLAVIVDARLRKCGNPNCRGLRKAVEYDIQLETENCVKYSPDSYPGYHGAAHLELGQDREELEAELKKMAPLNGRTVLIFRAPCGCPAGRLEVWGHKKVRRIKK